MKPLPEHFIRTVTDVFDGGTAWLEELPNLLERYQQRWSISIQEPFTLSYNYAAPATRADGTPVVLKAGVVCPELLCEIATLRHYNGHGIVRLLEADQQDGVMLLERLLPGTPLFEVNDDEQATRIAAEVMQKFWLPPPAEHSFPHVSDWAKGMGRLREEFGGGVGPFSPHLVEMAETLFAELLGSMAEPVLLHGDLHHWNILSAERAPWLALDPKGIVGEPAYEVGAWLRNPFPDFRTWPGIERIMARRVDIFSEVLGFDRKRIAGWGMAQAMLSAWWTYEDHHEVDHSCIACAEILARLV